MQKKMAFFQTIKISEFIQDIIGISMLYIILPLNPFTSETYGNTLITK